MAKEESLRFEGRVEEILPNAMFRVMLVNQHRITAYLGGKLRKHEINIQMGDGVIIEMSPYDLNRGRIVYRT